MQQRNRKDVAAVEPVGHINVFHLALGDGAEEHDGVGDPHRRNQNIDRPFQLGIFFGLGVAQRQGNRRQHNHQLPAPESKGRQPAAEQASVTGALHHIVRRCEKAAAAKRENHRVGMQRTDAPEVEPRTDVGQIQLRPAQLGGGNHPHQHADDAPNHGHHGKLAHHFIVVGLRFHCSKSP